MIFGLAVSLGCVGLAVSPSTWTRLKRAMRDGSALLLRVAATSVIVLLGLVLSPVVLLPPGLVVSPVTRTRLNRAARGTPGVTVVSFPRVVL